MSERKAKILLWAIAIAILVLGYVNMVLESRAQQSVTVPATTTQISVAGTVAARTKIITGVSGQRIYVTGGVLIPVATAVVTFSYGTGTNCGTGTTALTGDMTFAAGQILPLGIGNGTTMVVPSGNDLCITIATAAAPGFLSYSLF